MQTISYKRITFNIEECMINSKSQKALYLLNILCRDIKLISVAIVDIGEEKLELNTRAYWCASSNSKKRRLKKENKFKFKHFFQQCFKKSFATK